MKNKIVLCHGVFDLIHAGHLAYFEKAKTFGDTLVVSITSDKYVNKGPGRPYFNQDVRSKMLKALSLVDDVIISDNPRATEVINKIKPDFYVKGPDYKNHEDDISGGILEEVEAVEKNGGQVVYTEDQVYSSSHLLNRFFSKNTDEQNDTIAFIKKTGGFDLIKDLVQRMENLDVSVVGEPILDIYRFCDPQGVSSKSPSLSVKYSREEKYNGGSFAIINHVSSFVKSATLYTNNKTTFEQHKILANNVLVKHGHKGIDVVEKIRYISEEKGQRLLEVTKMNENTWHNFTLDEKREFIDHIFYNNKSDLMLMCDFGHGFFDEEVIRMSEGFKGYKALNCQTNSSNFGFNPFTKFNNFDYLSIDLREARVAYHNKNSCAEALFGRMCRDYSNRSISMTLGPKGAFFYQKGAVFASPTFADQIVDTIGAGDAYYAITALLNSVRAPSQFIPFLGNVFAGLKTKIIGNKQAVSKVDFLKAVEAILK